MGHILRGKGLIATMLEGIVEGTEKRGRKKTKILDDLTGGYQKLQEAARNRTE